MQKEKIMKVSVITVCRNSVNTIERTIKSVLRQNIEDLEYIIIDGDSTDGTQAIIEKYEKYISYWVSEPDEGLFYAMNKGIEKATGDIVAILNSDDYYEDETLKKVIKYFQDNHIDILTGNEYVIGKGGKREGKFQYNSMDEIHKRIIFMHPAFFVKRQCYKRIGAFNTKYKFSADYDWMIRAYDAGFSILDVNDFFVNCSEGGIGSTNSRMATIEQREIALKYRNDLKIESYYNDKIEYAKYIDTYNKFIEKTDSVVWQLLRGKAYEILGISAKKSIYIWGTGLNGIRLYNLFFKMGITISAFVESYKTKELFHDVQVILPDELEYGSILFISPFEYKDEIKERIKRERDKNKKEIDSYVGYEFFNRLTETCKLEI